VFAHAAKLPPVRIVAGIAKGRRLVAPKGETTRPTSDFVREAVFNTLLGIVDLDGASVLDLFAGTGALGIEALSRGAATATFVERDRAALGAIRANLDAVGFADRAKVVAGDATRVGLPAADVVFADPPYSFDAWPDLIARLGDALVVAESDREIDPGEGRRVLKTKRYGTTVVTLSSPRSDR
jgi:16S rRNA (guanine966-N2)-methyltransferase